MSDVAATGGLHVKMMILQWGPIPPSGGPHRDRYLDRHGRDSLAEADGAYAEALALLAGAAGELPTLPAPIIEYDELVRRGVQRQKRVEWIRFVAGLDEPTLDAVEPHIKKSVSAAMAALNYLEDHPLREKAHEAIHRAAFVRRGLFGCAIVLRDDEFWTDCPINLSHLRMGVSAGLVSDFACSICGRLVEDCDHQMGMPYPKLAERDLAGSCTLCGALSCEHSEGETYLIEAYANAQNARATEVSFVARPRYPQARVVEMTKRVGPEGDDPRVRHAAENGCLNCDADLGPCKGFNEMGNWNFDSSQSECDLIGQVDEL